MANKKSQKLFTLTNDVVDKNNIEEVMQQAITLELATIPTYLSTYYSINRAQDQDILYAKLHKQLSKSGMRTAAEIEQLAQELKLDILVYANKSAALIMSVAIEEMLHLSLACNVKQSFCQKAPDLMGIGKVLSFPAYLDGHKPEFKINTAKLSLDQLTTFLMIESPDPFTDPNAIGLLKATVDYKTIGQLYEKIITYIEGSTNPEPYKKRPQLLPPEETKRPRPYYSQNSINTVHYDRNHKPQFANTNDTAGLVGVHNKATAIEALHRIIEQGEGSTTTQNKKPHHTLQWDKKTKMAVPMEIIDGEDGGKTVKFLPGDYEDGGEELAHFAKFLEAYSLGGYYQEKFTGIDGLDDFFSYFVYNQATSPTLADYQATDGGNQALALADKLASAVFAYILLMIETCYHKEEDTQYNLFMFGIHKSMIWFLSEIGNHLHKYTFSKGGETYQGALTFEPYIFENHALSPKEQILEILAELSKVDSYWSDWGDNYFPSLPDVGLDHVVKKDIPNVPSTPYTHHH